MSKSPGGADKIPTIPRIRLPSPRPWTDQERERRRRLYERTVQLREEIGTIDIPTYELVREGRDEDIG